MLAVLRLERAVIVQPGVFYGNDVTIDALQSSDRKWRGIALLDADVEPREIERLHAVGFRGVRLNPRNEKKDVLKDMDTLAHKIAPFGWHLQFHLDARELVTLGEPLRRLPVDIVVDHLGHMPVDAGVAHPGFQILIALLKEGRCWVKLSSPNRFGVLGGDAAGFPNGRRVGDDVTDIAIRAMAGATPLTPSFNNGINAQLGDGVDGNDMPYLDVFPYLGLPHPGNR